MPFTCEYHPRHVAANPVKLIRITAGNAQGNARITERLHDRIGGGYGKLRAGDVLNPFPYLVRDRVRTPAPLLLIHKIRINGGRVRRRGKAHAGGADKREALLHLGRPLIASLTLSIIPTV